MGNVIGPDVKELTSEEIDGFNAIVSGIKRLELKEFILEYNVRNILDRLKLTLFNTHYHINPSEYVITENCLNNIILCNNQTSSISTEGLQKGIGILICINYEEIISGVKLANGYKVRTLNGQVIDIPMYETFKLNILGELNKEETQLTISPRILDENNRKLRNPEYDTENEKRVNLVKKIVKLSLIELLRRVLITDEFQSVFSIEHGKAELALGLVERVKKRIRRELRNEPSLIDFSKLSKRDIVYCYDEYSPYALEFIKLNKNLKGVDMYEFIFIGEVKSLPFFISSSKRLLGWVYKPHKYYELMKIEDDKCEKAISILKDIFLSVAGITISQSKIS